MTFHEKISRLTEDRHKSKFASRIGLGRYAIYDLIAKKSKPSAHRALLLARALSVSVEWLIDDQQNWPPVFTNQPQSASAA